MRQPLACFALLLAAGTVACEDTSFKVNYAPGYQPRKVSLSIFGVFRGGRMSFDSWSSIGTALSTALGAEQTCEPGYSERLQHEDEDLFASIDDETRNNGVNEDLLAKLEPQAEGDVILTISIHGSLPSATTPPNPNQEPPQSPGNAPPTPTGGLGAGRNGRGQQRQGTPKVAARKSLDFTASLYSKRLHRPVARLDMSYEGTSNEDAVHRFATAVASMAPGSGCRGWIWGGRHTPAPAAPASAPAPPPALPVPLQDGP
jgi:hypothetical protein